MSITLTITNHNPTATECRVYRSDSRFTGVPATAPIATLDPSATTYTDESALSDTLYFYMISVMVEGEEIPGNTRAYADVAITGPGPTSIIRGDWDYGFFGIVDINEMFTAAELYTALGSPSIGIITSDIGVWSKFAWKGKVIFVPSKHFSNATNLTKALYEAGMFYGTGDTGPKPANNLPSSTLVVQDKSVVKDAYKFLVRAPLGTETTDPAVFTTGTLGGTNGEVPEFIRSELAVLVMSQSAGAAVTAAGIAAWYAGTGGPAPTLTASTGLYGTTAAAIVSQHYYSATIMNVASTQSGTPRNMITTATISAMGYFVPLLELRMD